MTQIIKLSLALMGITNAIALYRTSAFDPGVHIMFMILAVVFIAVPSRFYWRTK